MDEFQAQLGVKDFDQRKTKRVRYPDRPTFQFIIPLRKNSIDIA